jgi:hypothetical protein
MENKENGEGDLDEEDLADLGQGGYDMYLSINAHDCEHFKDELIPLALEYYLGVIDRTDPDAPDNGDY